MDLLLSELLQRVQELYDSAPGSSTQREADQWLTSFVNVEGAWEVLLHVLSNAAQQQQQQQQQQSQATDVRLLFISAKILQLKIQRDWRTCPPETRQVVQQCLSSHLQHEALGTASPHAPIVHNQLVLAFVHMVLQVLAENKTDAPTPSFVLDLCQMFGITGTPDLATQTKPLLLVLEVLKWLPEEYNRRDPGSSRRDRRTIKLQRADSQITMELIRVVIDQCDGVGGNYGGLEPTNSRDVRSKIKLASLMCLRSWTEHTTLDASWATTTDMMVWGILAVLERQATLASGAEALPAEMYAMVLQILTDGFRNQHFFGSSDPKGPQGGPEEAALRKQAFSTVARIVLVMGQYVMQRGNEYEEEEEVGRSACEALATLLQWHLAPLFVAYRDNMRGTPEGDSVLSLVRELLQLLVQFTGHADLSGVAEPPLELWYFLPELLDLQESFTPEAGALLADVVPSLVETIHRQCVAPAAWGEKEWGVAFMNRSARKSQADQDGEGEGGGGETDWDQFMDLIYFRTGANDVIEAMASNWPEKNRPGEVLYTLMNRCNDNPLAVEAVLLCLTGVARGLQSGDDYYATDEDEVEEDEHGGGDGGDYGYGDDEEGGDDDEIYMSEEAREQKRQETARQRQPDLWLAVLQAITSLQDPGACFYLWRTACVLIRELARVYLVDLATPTVVEHVIAFLVRALTHRFTCSAAAMALKNVVSACCSSARGNLAAGKEAATKQRLISLVTSALTAATQQQAPEQARVLLNQPQAYANVVESLVILILTAVPAVNDSSAPALHEQLGATVTSTLGTTPARGRGASAQVLSAILAGVRRGKGLELVDTLLQRAWPVIDQVVFGALIEQENPTMAVQAACKVLGAILRAVSDKALFLPLVVAKLGPLVEFNGQILEHYRNALLPSAAAQQRKPSPQEMTGVVLWPAPLVFLRRVLAAGGETSLEGWWPAFQQVTDAVCRLAAQGLALKIGDEDEHGNQVRRQLLVDYYKELFEFLKDVVAVSTDGAPPMSLVSEDPYCARRGLELVILALELPLENSGCLSKVLAYLSAALRLFPEDMLLPAVRDLAPRLTVALLQVLVSTINMPTNIKRATADVLHLALFGPNGNKKNRMQVPALFQQALSLLLASQGEAQLQAIFVQNPSAVDWVRESFLAMLQQAPVGPSQKVFVEFIKYFAGLARNEMTLEEVRQSVERNEASASIFPDL